MPELPEVEYVKRRLERWMRGATIVDVDSSDARTIRPTSARTFAERVKGRDVETVDRRGKWLRCVLDDGGRIFVHLGMSGWIEHETAADPARRPPRVPPMTRSAGRVLSHRRSTR